MGPEFLIILAVIIIGFAGLFWYMRKSLSSSSVNMDSNEVVNTVLTVAKEKFDGDKQMMSAEMNAKKEAIEQLVKDLRTDIEVRQKEIRALEQDRNLKFGELTKSLEEHRQMTSELKGSADELKKVLSNSQLRGSWGERQLEQIFHNAGFLEGQHYLIQHQLPSGVRPDFVVKLPQQKVICIDAKFPFANLQLMTQTDDKTEKARLAKVFSTDVKARINEVAGKGYISPEDGTMDFAIMFVPSEVVFDYINKSYADLVDEAMSKKVIMASPYNVLAIVRMVLEAHKHFAFESGMRDIFLKLDAFAADWLRFQDEFNKLGVTLGKSVKDYEQITGTRYKQLDLRMRQIQSSRSGIKDADLPDSSALLEGVTDETDRTV